MPSPDLTPYVDLTIYDKNPQDVFNLALSMLQVKIPEWTPREGNTEVLLLESMALEVAEMIFAINRLPNAIMEALMRLYGVQRDPGAPPTTSIRFNMSGTQGYTIPLGSNVLLESQDGTDPIAFRTTQELTIAIGQTFGIATAVGDTFTDAFNGRVAGTEVEVLDALIYVDNAVLATNVLYGRSAEQDADYFDRSAQRLARLTDTLVLPLHFVALALEQPYIEKAFAVDNYNPALDPDNNGPVGNNGGHITLFVYGDGAPVSAPNLALLAAEIAPKKLANLVVNYRTPSITTVNVTTTVVSDKGYTNAQVQANVQAALAAFFATANWNWSNIVRRNELIQVIGNAEGVAYVNTLTVPAGDQNLAGVVALTAPGTFSVVAS